MMDLIEKFEDKQQTEEPAFTHEEVWGMFNCFLLLKQYIITRNLGSSEEEVMRAYFDLKDYCIKVNKIMSAEAMKSIERSKEPCQLKKLSPSTMTLTSKLRAHLSGLLNKLTPSSKK